MILKEYNIKDLKMNGMFVGFEKAKVVVEEENIHLFGAVSICRLEWTLTMEYIETNLEHIHKHKILIEIEMLTDQWEKLSGIGQVTAIEEKVLTEITGIDALEGYEVEG